MAALKEKKDKKDTGETERIDFTSCTGNKEITHTAYLCKTCDSQSTNENGADGNSKHLHDMIPICKACATRCHAGHDIMPYKVPVKYSCQCFGETHINPTQLVSAGFSICIVLFDKETNNKTHITDIEGVPVVNGNAIPIKHDSKYGIELRNDTNERADSVIKIDGVIIGTFTINPQSSYVIKRSERDDREFIFVDTSTNIATEAGVQIGREENGVIDALFKVAIPKKKVWRQQYTPVFQTAQIDSSNKQYIPFIGGGGKVTSTKQSAPVMRGLPVMRELHFPSDTTEGATVLGEETGQQITYVSALNDDEIDWLRSGHYQLKMVVKNYKKPVALAKYYM